MEFYEICDYKTTKLEFLELVIPPTLFILLLLLIFYAASLISRISRSRSEYSPYEKARDIIMSAVCCIGSIVLSVVLLKAETKEIEIVCRPVKVIRFERTLETYIREVNPPKAMSYEETVNYYHFWLRLEDDKKNVINIHIEPSANRREMDWAWLNLCREGDTLLLYSAVFDGEVHYVDLKPIPGTTPITSGRKHSSVTFFVFRKLSALFSFGYARG